MTKTKLRPIGLILLFVASLLSSNLALGGKVSAERDIVFPVIGSSTYSNDFNAPRDGGARVHHAIDIIANKGQYLVAAAKGTIVDVQYPEPSWGYSVTIQDDDGYKYRYIHMNDDTPGTNDGHGGGMNAYAADVREGNRVARGQLIGHVGDSGNSNGISHLHFEMFLPNGNISNPYQSLRHATRISKPAIPGRVTDEILPYGPTFKGGANIAMGNFDLDPQSEFVVSAGKGGSPSIKVYQNDSVLSKGFLAYDAGFKGGVDVAAGDIDGDGIDEIITTPILGGAHIRVFKPDGTLVTGFFAYGSSVKNGLKAAAGDVNGDTKDEIIVGLGAGTEPRVKVFDMASGMPDLIHSFLAYKSTFRGGVDVAAGDVLTASAFDEIITAAGPGGSPQVRVLTGDGTALDDFRAYGDSMKGGVRISAGNVDIGTLTEEILTVPASAGSPQIKMVTGNGVLIDSNMFIEQWWIGGYDVAAGFDTSKGITGTNRRVSVRPGID